MIDTPETTAPVGIDTNILIYALQDPTKLKKADRKQGERNRRYAERLFRRLHSEKRRIMISVITVAEYLVKVPEAQHSDMIRAFEDEFTIAPFNRQAASFAARIVASTKESKKAVRVTGGRPVIMADTKIVASLIAADAREIFFGDAGAVKIAKRFTKASSLPTEPNDLFEWAEDNS